MSTDHPSKRAPDTPYIPWPLTTVRTKRLTLREYQTSDTSAFYDLESQPDVVRYQMWHPRTKEQAEKNVIERIAEARAEPRRVVELVVELDGAFIGRVGAKVHEVEDETSPSDPSTDTSGTNSGPERSRRFWRADLWFSFEPAVQGKGYATEATSALIELLGDNVTELEIECDPRNAGSAGIAKRLGFELVSRMENAFECKGEWVGSLVFRRGISRIRTE